MGSVSHFSTLGSSLDLSASSILLFVLLVTSTVMLIRFLGTSSGTGSPILDNAPKIGLSSTAWFSSIRAKFQYIQSGFHMIHRAYEEHPNDIFLAPDRELFVLPPKYIDELKSQPISILSSSHAIVDYFLGAYTTLNISLFGPITWKILQGRLINQVGELVETLDDECLFAFTREISECREWTPIAVHPSIQRVIARMNARIFVGESLCRNELWISTSIDFSTCIFRGTGYLKIVPWFLRPVAALLIPYFRRIRRHHQTARKLLVPEILRRRELAASSKEQSNTRPSDMFEWLEETSSGEDLDPECFVNRQLGLCFAATDGTTNHIVNVLYDLAARWDQYAHELRSEIEEALKENGWVIRRTTVNQLSKLDSFMKESQRLNPLSALSFKRKVMTSHTLSDGIVLPRSTQIGMASGPMAMSSKFHTAPETFDGFRFHHMRQTLDSSNAHQFTTTGLGSLMFGHGKYACPGRFFASVESKIVLIHILQRYDMQLYQCAERPRNLFFADANIPDPTQRILFRKRAAGL